MDNMRKTLIAALVIAGAAGQVVAQLVKEDTITLSLKGERQISVSNSKSVPNDGNWSSVPEYYKTESIKYGTSELLRSIDKVLKRGYSSQAKLVLVQGELSGFFNIDKELEAVKEKAGNNAPGPKFDATTYTSTIKHLSVRLANGRHIANVPAPFVTAGSYPPGHFQPWGQIFVKDPVGPKCDNVTHFFSISVEECYDCFYLNSFITDTTFTFKAGTSSGPPCCTVPENLLGNGKDRYYMMLGFDNTTHNPFLNKTKPLYYQGVEGLTPFGKGANVVDGITPDGITPYQDPIRANLGGYIAEVSRFTLNGIMTYTWSLKLLNKNDVAPDFLGTGKYEANGYGFFGLYCSLLTGSFTFSEKTVNAMNVFCCYNEPWNDSWFGIGYNSKVGKLGGITPTATPVNEKPSLTYHSQYDEDNESVIQHP